MDDVDSRQFEPGEAAPKDEAASLALNTLNLHEADGVTNASQAAPHLTLELGRYIVDMGLARGFNMTTEVRRFEQGIIERALELTKGNQKRAAELLGLQSSTLNTKIKKYGLKASRRTSAMR
jgi:DNA-binding NtrC family response regulator